MFYVYALIDPDSGKVFYIGKGTGNRVNTHEKFISGCNNVRRDAVIKKILKNYDSVPYNILEEFDNEDEAYIYEEKIILEIGIDNLTNIETSGRPPNQSGKKRSQETIKKIKENSKKQGKERTIEHIKQNAELFYNILNAINNRATRSSTIKNQNITIDLFNKVKRKYTMYVTYLNNYTDYYINPTKVSKTNGMQAKVFYENKDLLLKMYKLISEGKKRRNIASELNISLEFYDRMRKKEKDFNEYFGLN
jgi:hypothetical protein